MLSASFFASFLTQAHSQDRFFNQTNFGDFALAANWQGSNPPSTGFANTFVGSSALGSPPLGTVTAYLNTDITSWATGSLFLGQGSSGNATLIISNGGSLQYGAVYIGRDAGAVGVLNQLGGTNRVNTGTFEIQSGGASGTYNLSGGVLNTIQAGNIAIKVGTSGSGTGYFNMSGGTFNAGTNFATQQHSLNVGWGAKGVATFGGGTANITGDLNAGNGSNGLVTISNTALVNARSVNVGLNAGATNSRLTVTGGTLSVTNGIVVSNSSVLNMSGGTVSAAGLRIASGSIMTNSGGSLNIPAITNNGSLTFNRGDTLTLSGALSGAGTNRINGGTLALASGGTLSNTTIVNSGGTLSLNSGGAWNAGEITTSTNGTVRFNGGTGTGTASITAFGGTLDVNGQSLSSGSFANLIARTAGVKLQNSSTNAATIAAGNNTIWLYTASAEIETIGNLQIGSQITSAAAPSATGITKTGTGTLTLTANNNYTGATTVSAGALVVNGTNTSATTVQSGASLGGGGSVASVTIGSGGTIAPGNSPGTLTITNGLTWAGGGNYNWQIFSVSGTAGATNTWDLISVTGGTWDITGLSSTNKFNINLWSLSGLPETSGPLAGFNASTNYSWKILDASVISGTFNTNLFNINTAAVNGAGGFAGATGLFSLSMDGNNDLFLNYAGSSAAVPEPATWFAAAALGAAALLRRFSVRRCNKSGKHG